MARRRRGASAAARLGPSRDGAGRDLVPELAVQTLLWCVLAPGLVAAAIVLAATPWRGEARAGRVAYALGPAIGLAYVAGQWGLFGRPTLRPLDAPMWLWHVAVIGAAAGVVDAAAGPAVRWAHGARAALCALAAWLLLRLVAHQWSGGEYCAWVALAAAGMLAGWLALSHALADAHPAVGAGALVAWAAGAAGCVAASGSVVIGQRGGIVAAAAGAVLVAGIAFPRAFGRAGRIRPAIPPAVLLTGSVVLLGYVFASVSRTALVALGGVPVALLLVGLVTRRLQRPRVAAAALIVTALALSGGAAATAALGRGDAPPASGDDSADYGYEWQ